MQMKRLALPALLLLLLAMVAMLAMLGSSPVVAQRSDRAVVRLDDAYGSTRHGHWLVAFTASWCSHCVALKKTWMEVAPSLSTLRLGVVDCGKATGLCKKFNVQSYPTIKFVRAGEPMDFPFARSADSLRELDTLVALSSQDVPVAPADRVPVIPTNPYQRSLFVLAQSPDTKRTSASEHGRAFIHGRRLWGHEADFVVVQSEAQWSAYGLAAADLPAVVVLRCGDPARAERYTPAESWSESEFGAWVGAKRFPRVAELTRTSWEHLLGAGGKCGLVVGDNDPAQLSALLELAAVQLDEDELRLGWMSGHKSTQFVYKYGLNPQSFPALVVMAPTELLFWYEPSLEHSPEAYLAYLRSVLSGEIPGSTTNRTFAEKLRYAYSVAVSLPRAHPIYAIVFFLLLAAGIISFTFWYEARESRQAAAAQSASSSARSSSSSSSSSTTDVTRPQVNEQKKQD